MMDITMFEWIHGMAGKNALLDEGMKLLSNWGYIAFIGVIVITPFFPFKRKTSLLNLLSLAAALGINRGLKLLFDRPRPFVEMEVDILVPKAPSPSFPSDQALIAGVFASAVWFHAVKPIYRWVAVIAAVAVSFSRVFVGHHYPSDIAVGFLLGIGINAAVQAIANRKQTVTVQTKRKIPS